MAKVLRAFDYSFDGVTALKASVGDDIDFLDMTDGLVAEGYVSAEPTQEPAQEPTQEPVQEAAEEVAPDVPATVDAAPEQPVETEPATEDAPKRKRK